MQGMQSSSTPDDRQEQRPVPLANRSPVPHPEPHHSIFSADGPLEAAKRYLDRQKNSETALAGKTDEKSDGRPAWLRRWGGETRRETEAQLNSPALNQAHGDSEQEERALSEVETEVSDSYGAQSDSVSAAASGEHFGAAPAKGYSGQSIEAAFEFETVFQFETEFEAESTEDWLDLSDELDREERVARESETASRVDSADLSEAESRFQEEAAEPGTAIRAGGRSGEEVTKLLPPATLPGSSGFTAAPDPQAVRAAIFRLAQQSSVSQASRQLAVRDDSDFAEVARRLWDASDNTSDDTGEGTAEGADQENYAAARATELHESGSGSESESDSADLSLLGTGDAAIEERPGSQRAAGAALQASSAAGVLQESSPTEEISSEHAFSAAASGQESADEREAESWVPFDAASDDVASGFASEVATDSAAALGSTSIEHPDSIALEEDLQDIPAPAAPSHDRILTASPETASNESFLNEPFSNEPFSNEKAANDRMNSDLAGEARQTFTDLPIDGVAGPYSRWQRPHSADGSDSEETARLAGDYLSGIPSEDSSVPSAKQPPLETGSNGAVQDNAPVSAGGGPALAHDAGNLLSALKLYSELLALSGVLHARHKHYAEDLKLLAARSEVLIERLLASCTLAEQRMRGLIEVSPYRELPGFTTASPDARSSPVPQNPATSATQSHGGDIPTSVAGQGNVGPFDGAEPGSPLPVPASSGGHAEQNDSFLHAATEERHRDSHHDPQDNRHESGSPVFHSTTTAPVASHPLPSSLIAATPSDSKKAIPGPATADPINLVDLLTRWGSLLSMIARGPVQVKFGPQAALPIPVTEEAMERILVNLVHNAMKATKDGGAIRIGVGRAEPRRSPHEEAQARLGNRMVLTVDDSGCGMSEEQIAQTLGRSHSQGPNHSGNEAGKQDLYQGENRLSHDEHGVRVSALSTPTTTSGTGSDGSLASSAVPHLAQQRHGMGLQIVRELVALSGGELAIHSRRGVGTRIEIQWPTVSDAAELTRIPPASVRLAAESWRGTPIDRLALKQATGIGSASGDSALNPYRKPFGDHQSVAAGMEGAIAC